MATIDDIKTRANLVKNETTVGGNTAERVGGVLVDLADHMGDAEDAISSVDSTIEGLQDEVYGSVPVINDIAPTYSGSNQGQVNRWLLQWSSVIENGDVITCSCLTGYEFTAFLYTNGSISKNYTDGYTNSLSLTWSDGSGKDFRILVKKTDNTSISSSDVAANVTYLCRRTIGGGGGLVGKVESLEGSVGTLEGDVESLDNRVEQIEEDLSTSEVNVQPSDGTFYNNLGINRTVTPNVFSTVTSGSGYGSVLIPATQGKTYILETSASQNCAFGLIKNPSPAVDQEVIYPDIPNANWTLTTGTATRTTYNITESGCYFFIRNDSVSGGRSFPSKLYYQNDASRFIERNELLSQVDANSDNPVKSRAIYDFAKNSSREIKMLFIGNSLAQDAVMWLPYVLKYIGTGVKYQLVDMYNGGYTLTQHWTKINGGQTFEIASVCDNATGWTNYNNTKILDAMLNVIDFDYLVLQEYYNYKTSAEETDISAFNNIVDYIAARVTHPFEVVTLLHAPKRSDATAIYNRTVAGNQLILRETCASSLINVGTAIYDALSTDLDSLGTQGHLSPDGTHAQEGLPCVLEALNLAMWIYQKLGIAGGVVNFPWSPSPSSVYSTLNVAGANGSVIDGTTAQQLLASKVAAQSFTKNAAILVGANLQ